MLRIISFLVLLLLLSVHCLAAGISVHLTIASRLHPFLPMDIRFKYSSYLAGAFYPDAFYGCMGKSDYAEAAHWPPFLAKATELYLEKLNRYLSKKAQLTNIQQASAEFEQEFDELMKFKAFIYGIFTHQVADVSWHSLRGSHQGLLPFLAAAEFNGSVSDAHTFLDTAGDFILLPKMFSNLETADQDKLEEYYNTRWSIPINDIIEVYNRLGFPSLFKSQVQICVLRGYAALQGETSTVKTALSVRSLGYYWEHSPLLTETLDDYFYGGIDEMIRTTKYCMQNLNRWFNGDLDEDSWLVCSIFNGSKKALLYEDFRTEGQTLQISQIDTGSKTLESIIPDSLFGYSLTVLSDGTLAVGSPSDGGDGAVYELSIGQIFKRSGLVEARKISLTQDVVPSEAGLRYPPRFGFKTAPWTLSRGNEYLAVSEPGSSKIYIVSQGIIIASINFENAATSLGSSGLKHYGSHLYTYDEDGDGIEDLVLSSPTTDINGKLQQGAVFVLNGRSVYRKMQFGKMFHRCVMIKFSDVVKKVYRLPDRFELEGNRELFGDGVAFTKNIALISMTSTSSVIVFDRHTARYLSSISSLDIAAKTRATSGESGLFAHNFILTGKHNHLEWALISASGETVGDCVMCGAAYLYITRGFGLQFVVKIVPGQISFFSYSMFGTSATFSDVSTGTVIISGSGYDGFKGAVWEVSICRILDSWVNRDGTIRNEKIFVANNIIAIGPSGIGYTEFGKSLALSKHGNNRYLIVGMPRYGYYRVSDGSQYKGRIGVFEVE